MRKSSGAWLRCAPHGACDLAPAFATPYAVAMAGRMLGIELDQAARINEFYEAFAGAMVYDGNPEPQLRANRARAELNEILRRQVSRLRRAPNDSITSIVVNAGDETISEDEVDRPAPGHHVRSHRNRRYGSCLCHVLSTSARALGIDSQSCSANSSAICRADVGDRLLPRWKALGGSTAGRHRPLVPRASSPIARRLRDRCWEGAAPSSNSPSMYCWKCRISGERRHDVVDEASQRLPLALEAHSRVDPHRVLVVSQLLAVLEPGDHLVGGSHDGVRCGSPRANTPDSRRARRRSVARSSPA